MLVYDVTRRDSFDNIVKWLDEVKAHSHGKIEVALVGNKTDLEQRREVTTEDGEKFAKKNGFIFTETSALNGNGVNEIFEILATRVLKKIESKEINPETDSKCGVRPGKKNTSPRKTGSLVPPSTVPPKESDSCSC